MVERVWETFYSSGDQKKHKLHGDWTLPLVSIAYILMLLGMIWEFFVINRGINIFVMLIGIFIYGMSFLLRISGMLTLREQWSVHAVGAKKVKNVFLVKSGPYKYLRHPIYLGVILEVLGLPLIWNAYFVFIFTCTVSVPLQLMRAYFEEKATVRKLGKEYIDYKKTVPALIPFRLLIRNNK
ncbi:MAG: isoprenylcysteine carboxylmethyltransferase family protein [Candidatus Omnitrophica bacterium]|nr:isoprenylcysteine carboxylmethyltransferase family protein [Candidatus Omnitrophota bacterium]